MSMAPWLPRQLDPIRPRVLTGDRVALNLGTHSTIPDISGLAASSRQDHNSPAEKIPMSRRQSSRCCATKES